MVHGCAIDSPCVGSLGVLWMLIDGDEMAMRYVLFADAVCVLIDVAICFDVSGDAN
jgi:hypothetical protein